MTDHESAAFNGAASVTKPEAETRITHEEMLAMPWRYPQGRVPLPASHPKRISPPEDDDPWRDVRLPWPETLLTVAIWGASFAAAVSLLVWVFSKVTA